MSDDLLNGYTILVVEDEYFLADDLAMELEDNGAAVMGPAGTVGQGFALMEAGERPAAAVLDINLRGEYVFPLADELLARHIPFVFTTGYDVSTIPERFAGVCRCEKPVDVALLVQAVGYALSESKGSFGRDYA